MHAFSFVSDRIKAKADKWALILAGWKSLGATLWFIDLGHKRTQIINSYVNDSSFAIVH